MATVLKPGKVIKREVEIDGVAHTVTLSAEGISIIRKGCRRGAAGTWSRARSVLPDNGK